MVKRKNNAKSFTFPGALIEAGGLVSRRTYNAITVIVYAYFMRVSRGFIRKFFTRRTRNAVACSFVVEIFSGTRRQLNFINAPYPVVGL